MPCFLSKKEGYQHNITVSATVYVPDREAMYALIAHFNGCICGKDILLKLFQFVK